MHRNHLEAQHKDMWAQALRVGLALWKPCQHGTSLRGPLAKADATATVGLWSLQSAVLILHDNCCHYYHCCCYLTSTDAFGVHTQKMNPTPIGNMPPGQHCVHLSPDLGS